MEVKLPLTAHSKKGDICRPDIKLYNAWLCKEPELFSDEECNESDDSNNSNDSEDDQFDTVYRDTNGKRVGGLIKFTDHNVEVMICLNKGWNMRTYPYPRVKIPFSSPMVRWWNLFYCGGFGIRDPNDVDLSTNEELIDAVIAKKKPIGFASLFDEKLQPFVDKVKSTGLPYHVKASGFRPGHYFLGVCQTTTFGETFNITLWLMSYTLMSHAANTILLDKSDVEFFLSLKDKPLSFWLKDWNYAHAHSNRDLALTGLLLGYSIESTVSIMLQ